MSVNRVILVGNVGRDAVVTFTASGVAVCRFSLATNERFKNKAGEVEPRTEWHSIVAWSKLAEVCGEYLTEGKQVYIEGSIRSGQWEDQEGNERKSFNVVAYQMRMLSSSVRTTFSNRVQRLQARP
ncbi:MAG: single-stranded DNA-binding protein [Terriglobia bacterium]